MNRRTLIPADELAAFLNEGWPGPDWYLTDHAEFLWERTFTQGCGAELYRPHRPGQIINLAEYDAAVRWQGSGTDPTHGDGYRLIHLFHRWQRTRTDVTVVICVPHDRLPDVLAQLADTGCLVVNADRLPAPPRLPREEIAHAQLVG